MWNRIVSFKSVNICLVAVNVRWVGLIVEHSGLSCHLATLSFADRALFDGVVIPHQVGQGVQESSKSCHIRPPEVLIRDRLTPVSIPRYIDGGVRFHCVAAFGAFAWTDPRFRPVIFGTVTVVVGGNPAIVGRKPRFLGGHYIWNLFTGIAVHCGGAAPRMSAHHLHIGVLSTGCKQKVARKATD